jgi:hypothetical protein
MQPSGGHTGPGGHQVRAWPGGRPDHESRQACRGLHNDQVGENSSIFNRLDMLLANKIFMNKLGSESAMNKSLYKVFLAYLGNDYEVTEKTILLL